MDMANIDKAKERFEILQTGECGQTAVVTLSPGDSSGTKVEAHEKSDQVLFMLEGELNGEVGYEYPSLKKGDVNIISAGVKHCFTNRSGGPVVTFNVYSPPEYPAGTKSYAIPL